MIGRLEMQDLKAAEREERRRAERRGWHCATWVV